MLKGTLPHPYLHLWDRKLLAVPLEMCDCGAHSMRYGTCPLRQRLGCDRKASIRVGGV